MPRDDEGFMPPDEFQQTYGIDPTPIIEQTKPIHEKTGERSFLARYGGNLAVGAATAYPSIVALPETVYAGGEALYNSYANDTSFLDEFAKSRMIEGGQQNIINHLNSKAGQWAQADPSLSEEALQAKLAEYQNSKEFEHFTHGQFKGGIGVYSSIEDAALSAVGDTRTEAQKDWTDTATQIVGGALVGGPAGIPQKIAMAAAKRATTNALLNNPISRATIKGIELTTPVTLPYTAPNIAANAIVGTALDQSLRFAQGQDTAFTPKEESPGVSTLVLGTGGIVGTAALVAAMRGRHAASLQTNVKNELAKAVEKSPTLRGQVTEGTSATEPTVVSGREQQLEPPSALDVEGVSGAATRMRGDILDEGAPLLKQLYEARPNEWRSTEATYRMSTGPVLEDSARQATEAAMHDLDIHIDAASPQNKAAIEAGMIMSTIKSRYNRVEDTLLTKIENMEAKGTAKKGNKAYEALVDDLERLRNDKDATARLALPNTARSEVNRLARIYETSTDEQIVRVRNAHKEWADKMMHNEVVSNRMDGAYGAELRRLDPYYTPLKSDPLGGTKGLERVRRTAVRSIKRVRTKEVATSSALSRESPIRQLKLAVPKKTENKKYETRITAVQNPRSAMKDYTIDSYRSVAKEVARTQFIDALAKDKDGRVSQFVKDGHMQSVPNPRTGNHWTKAEKVFGNEDLVKLMNDDRHVPQWKGGSVRLWKFGDREIALALRHDPVRMTGLMGTVESFSSWFKFFTTGAGNPVFSVKGALYNILVNMITRRGDRAYGSLSYAIHRFLPKPVANIARAMTFDFDPTVLLTAPYHTLASITEFMVWAGARRIADRLKTMPEFAAFRQAVGEQKYQAMVKRATSIAAWTDNFATLKMMRGGATHGIRSTDKIGDVHSTYATFGDYVPDAMRGAYSFYKGLLDSIYLGGSRPYYTQNHALLANKYGGASKIPKNELTQLMHETRTIGGDMSLVPASEKMRNLEAAFPYLSQAKLGTLHLVRNIAGRETFHYVIPRLFMGVTAVGASFYWRTYWNEESRREFWQRRPEYDRYRMIDVPTPQLLWAWANGENPAYNRSLYYSITLPPDFVGIVAGSAAIMQEMGMFPQDATPKPILRDVPNLWLNSLTPAMPPLLQAALAQSGAKFDPQGSEARGGAWLKVGGNQFRAGPQAESLSNLGQVSNSTALTMNALFGAFGSYLAASTDVLLHASKFQRSAETGNVPTPKDQQDFMAGLGAATGTFVEKATQGLPDVPLLWQNRDKYRVTTPAWQFVAENNTHIRSIVGMRNDAVGKAAQGRRELAGSVGGMPEQAITDVTLAEVANVVNQVQSPTGLLGKQRQQYRELSAQSRSLVSAYDMPQEKKQAELDRVVKLQQDNMQQQHLMIKYMEQELGKQFGQALAPRLRGRPLTMANLNAIMRDSLGANAPPPDAAAAQE